MKISEEKPNKKSYFLPSVSIILATILVFCIIENNTYYLLIAQISILTASIVLMVYWFIRRQVLAKTEKWSIILSILVWLAFCYSLSM